MKLIIMKQTVTKRQINEINTEFLEKVSQIVTENIDRENMDVAFVATKMSMSHSTLYRKVKRLTNLSINEYIRKVKIKHGAFLITHEGYNISEATFMIGFYTRSYFRQCFKNEFGVTPSAYRKACGI